MCHFLPFDVEKLANICACAKKAVTLHAEFKVRITLYMIPSKRIICFVLLITGCMALADAQTRRQIRDSHRDFIYLNGNIGYQTFLNQEPMLKNAPGVGLEFGAGYHMYHNHFILSVGLEGHYGRYNIKPLAESRTFPNTPDSQGDIMTLNADIYDRKDMMDVMDLQVPLLLGGEWKHFYMKAGVKAGLNVAGTAVTKAKVTTTGTYDRFVDDFGNMPNHQFLTDQQVRSDKQKISFNPQVYATAEIGYRLGGVYTGTGADIPRSKVRYYVAAFAEYGILDMHKAAGLGEAMTPHQAADGSYTFQVNPAYNSYTFRDAKMNNLLAGVKFTVMFELPKAGKCIICQERDRRNARYRLTGKR